MKQTLFDEIGGLPTLRRVHKIFYDKVYAHPWLGQFFAGHSQAAIEERQTSFMGEKMGGEVAYMGKDLKTAHETMYVSQELFDLRQSILDESIREAGLSDEFRERWLRIDGAFVKMIVKESKDTFLAQSWPYKKHIIVPKPEDTHLPHEVPHASEDRGTN